MATEASRDLELEPQELMWIESCLAPSQLAAREESAAAFAPGRETCLKVAEALLEALSGQSAVHVTFIEPELWVLRERVSIFASLGTNTQLGLSIKKKLYEAMLSIDNERGAGAVMEGFGMADSGAGGAISSQEVLDGVAKWKQANGIAGPDPTVDEAGRAGLPGKDDADDGPIDPARS